MLIHCVKPIIHRIWYAVYKSLEDHFVTKGELVRVRAAVEELERVIKVRIEAADQTEDRERAQCERLRVKVDNFGPVLDEMLLGAQAVHDLAVKLVAPITVGHGIGRVDVSVIVPTCDRPETLDRAIRSLAAQTVRPARVIVVDDGVIDASWVINSFPALNILLLRTQTPYSGPTVTRNLALDFAQTSVIAWLDDDNVMWPTWLERGAAYLEEDSTIDLIYGAQLRDNETSLSKKFWFHVPFDFDRLRQGNFVDLNQIMHRRNSCRFDPNLRRLVDWDFLLRFIGNSPERVARVPAIASIYCAGLTDRITVIDWPPDLSETVVNHHLESQPESSEGRVCSCCAYRGEFVPGPDGRLNAGCPECGALERHRFLQLMAPSIIHYWIPETRRGRFRAIEVAPSRATARFRDMCDIVLTLDPNPDSDGRVVDTVASLTNLPISDSSVDVMLALHVLEHIPDDLRAMREIFRVLLPHGLSIVQVPLSGRAATDEGEISSATERIERFGQADHVRVYGDDFFKRLRDSGLESISITPRKSMGARSISRYGLLADQALVFAVRSDSPRALERLTAFERAMSKGSEIMGQIS